VIRSFWSPFARPPLAASIAGHCGVVALLLLYAGHLPPAPRPIARGGIEIMLMPPAPPVVKVEPPPEPPPLVVEAEPPRPPPPVVKAEPPPPPLRLRPKPVVRRPPPVREPPPQPVPFRVTTPVVPPPPAPVQSAAIPRPAPPPVRSPGPIVSAGYRAALGAWLESHKHYPEDARARGETGQAVLRFHVDRSGRVLSYAITHSTGHRDLDAAIDRMMQGASLPPFPQEMAASDIDVSVAIRFALAR